MSRLQADQSLPTEMYDCIMVTNHNTGKRTEASNAGI